MKRIVLGLVTTVTALVLLFGYHTSTSSRMAAGKSVVAAPVRGSAAGPTGGSTAPPTAESGTAAPSAASRTVTGDAADTRYGPVQVQLSVSGRRITDVAVVEYPDRTGRDQRINAEALPILVQETLRAQGGRIDMVSGATYTSEGYLSSLQSALDRAGL